MNPVSECFGVGIHKQQKGWRERVRWMRKVGTWGPTLEEGEGPAEEEGGGSELKHSYPVGK